ncbi:recF/RecN/SMC N terminal domain protein [Acinetobacter sp. 742879]|uniref:AAA family ATPase n=1 Tax=Acinetobacter sp. 742879 TaxID=1310791 RepID=UPI00044AA3A5|nr:ATP-binding protein [Acinetobacter sp. 742879]EXS27106.1 recF/RecN/SMC N terminal domain protein [Acinetobacter sp. 742879]
MKIKYVEIDSLFGRDGIIILNFHDDINVLTGKNGAGKTNILKLVWYIISGNIDKAIEEINFRNCLIRTDLYEIRVNLIRRNYCTVSITPKDRETLTFMDYQDEDVLISAEDEANRYIKNIGSSVFLPTFRRIEGGFTLDNNYNNSFYRKITKNEIEDALGKLSTHLSNNDHVFVTSISSVDISNLLLKEYTKISEYSNEIQKDQANKIISSISSFSKDDRNRKDELEEAIKLIDKIKTEIEFSEKLRNKAMKPLLEVQNVVQKIFKKSGIEFTKKITFGDAATAIKSNMLSAGEKQMLSFICYNAFYNNTIFFIDEPELSLHVDWQRRLFLMLNQQNPSNQFIITTHSPFIYSKYPEKEVCVDIRQDKGNSENLGESNE